MRRLIHQHSAAFTLPGAAPGIAGIISHIPPAVHVDSSQDRFPDLPLINGLPYPHGWREETPLTDRGADPVVLRSCFQNSVAVFQRRGQRLFNRYIGTAPEGFHSSLPMDGVRGTDADNIQTAFFDHGFDRRIGLCAVFLSESLCPVRLHIIDRAQFTTVNSLISSSMEGADLPASDDPCTYSFLHKS